jgi:hypothetical protein
MEKLALHWYADLVFASDEIMANRLRFSGKSLPL